MANCPVQAEKPAIRMVTLKEWLDRVQEPLRPQVKEGQILCCTCGRPADTLHLLPYNPAPKEWPYGYRLEAACPDHDPGGYWFRIADLARDPFGWLCHLNNKVDDRVRALLWGLEGEGWKAVAKRQSRHRKKGEG